MNGLDTSVLQFLNQFAQRSPFADRAISSIADNSLLTGALIMSVYWWAWFRDRPDGKDRRLILSAIALAAFSLAVARALAMLLPFRERPLHDPAMQFRIPVGVDPHTLMGWSSFPSDHAALFCALAGAIFFLSRRAGTAGLIYVLLVVCLPRIYMGVHYPTDVIAGAALGLGIALLLRSERLRDALSAIPMRWLRRSPASFYPCFYLLTFLFGTMFYPLRTIVGVIWHGGAV